MSQVSNSKPATPATEQPPAKQPRLEESQPAEAPAFEAGQLTKLESINPNETVTLQVSEPSNITYYQNAEFSAEMTVPTMPIYQSADVSTFYTVPPVITAEALEIGTAVANPVTSVFNSLPPVVPPIGSKARRLMSPSDKSDRASIACVVSKNLIINAWCSYADAYMVCVWYEIWFLVFYS